MKILLKNSRRDFIRKNALLGAVATLGIGSTNTIFAGSASQTSTPAVLGGKPMCAKHEWPDWPIWKPETDEKRLLEVMRSGIWSRAKVVAEFEKRWAEMMGSKRCLALVNGTNALNTSVGQLDIGWGDEVLVTSYTFIASVSPILINGAMPVFVDIDPDTFQMDPDKIEAKITPRTKAIIPVHILGLPCDMERIMAIAKKHNLIVLEDSCQAWLAEVNHKKVGTFGHAGCFSFQNSKNFTMGEGGAIISDDDEFMDRCFSYHAYGNPVGTVSGAIGIGAIMAGNKLRLTEYQAAIGLAQLVHFEEQTTLRNENAPYLKSKIEHIPGIIPYKLYPNVTRAAYHFFPFRYKKEEFKGLSRDKFLKALQAEGVKCFSGYTELTNMPFLKNTFNSRVFNKFYTKEYLNYDRYASENKCPINEKVCNEEAVWVFQNLLLGTKQDLDNIAMAIERIQKNADLINKKG